ncbi:fungal-specific transcription factor domain-containing protein [Hypoxylon trugodes]|uniref:fungal-specific transcription factor domain-containing protein n=1 Tax=Hypoxylon trugodes TaxID=326681 RepID=UPI002192E049|nr:fungal-specific transcription factor domain-containing protein [Hypoxylon trugodes]KAI1389946.1 fungal-specific transcription factor domain-containing protein [Hypoxylon trugodes]
MPMECTSTENNKPFSCPACPSRFTRQENLNRHTASVHRKSNRRPFPCPLCDVSFSRSDLRKRHIRKCHPQQVTVEQPSVGGHNPPELMPSGQDNIQSLSSAHAPPGNLFDQQPSQNSGGDAISSSASNVFSPENISWLFRLPQFISAFFERFYPSLPAIHQPTFDVTTAREPLLQAVACIGALYQAPGGNHSISLALFEAGLRTLDKYVREDRSRFREIWVIQAYILFEYFAIYSCRDDTYSTGIRIHRRVVDAARQFQMLQDGALTNNCGSGTSPVQSHASPQGLLPPSLTPEQAWNRFIENETRKRTMYCLYYIDSQISVCCNVRPLLTALEVKYELPCRDDVWCAPTAAAWNMLVQAPEFSFNEEDDADANFDPRPAYGDLYETLMHLMDPDPSSRPLGLLWYSSFASLMLVMQIQMMTRELTLASTFLYNNVRCNDTRHSLSIITEANRAPIMQALNNLAELMPKPGSNTWPIVVGTDPTSTIWHPVWMAWHYTAISLTHQDALLSSGIVEYSLPTAISTAWELGKPRAKAYRDIYEDRDVVRVIDNLEHVIKMLTSPPMGSIIRDTMGATNETSCIEDPFVTMLGFKACMMGWRVIRLMALGLEQPLIPGTDIMQLRQPNIHSISAQVVLAKVTEALSLGTSSFPQGNDKGQIWSTFQDLGLGLGLSTTEAKYLEWTERTFAMRDVWPLGEWIVAVFNEPRHEAAGTGAG